MDIVSSRVLFAPSDYARSVSFYRDVIGLAIAREYSGGTVFFAGQSLLELTDHAAGATERTRTPGGSCALWLQVRNVYTAEDELRARGVHITRQACQEPWGLHEMHITDPDGVLLIFVHVPDDHPLRRDTRTSLKISDSHHSQEVAE